ncbi:MAG: aryl-sulfate sulfotransferase, partial [Anaerolineae bacterium]
FTHQHDPNYVGPDQITIYDNGDLRCANTIEQECHSRGQVYTINEAEMMATLELSMDLGNYSPALGSAQPLRNGSFHFESGLQGPPFFGTADEVLPDGTKIYALGVGMPVYRSFRMSDLYTAPHYLAHSQ